MESPPTPISILVVDDEALILHVLEEALEAGGFDVATAVGSARALEMLDRPGSHYRAVVTDVNMGKDNPSGWDVARHARELFPDMPIV